MTEKELTVTVQTDDGIELAGLELKFKALGDRKRLQIMRELVRRGNACVCDLCDIIDMPQSKLSYHLKILLDANLLKKETSGTWSYYCVNLEEIHKLLSSEIGRMFEPGA